MALKYGWNRFELFFSICCCCLIVLAGKRAQKAHLSVDEPGSHSGDELIESQWQPHTQAVQCLLRDKEIVSTETVVFEDKTESLMVSVACCLFLHWLTLHIV
jgi:hypothetical protein